jgi:predicted amidohydrolase YtcJ
MRAWPVAAACVVAAAGAVAVAAATGGSSVERASDAPEAIIHNARITTMDDRGSTVQALAIRDGVIVAAGDDGPVKDLAGDGTRMIDAGGRRVLPGLVDAHLSAVSAPCFSRSPRFDALFKRRDALLDVADRAARTPAGKWLFQLGTGWNVAQLDVPGMLTRAELDAIAPSHPVYLQGAGMRGGQLNGLGLRTLGLRAGRPGVEVGSTGRPTGHVTGAANARALAAVAAEQAALTPDEREACTRDLIRELNRRGLTAWDDPAGRGYDAVNRLHRVGELNARVRINLGCDGAGGIACVRRLTATRIGETGDASLRIGGIGEHVLETGARGVYPPAEYGRILRVLASREWAFEQPAPRATTQHGMVDAWEQVNARTPITGLRWRMLAPGAGPAEPNEDALARLRDLNAGVVPTDASVTGGTSHPPYRRIFESGTRACRGSGGSYPPFVGLWYAISGRTGVPARGGVARDQRLDRMQALALATRRCDWFMSLDGRIGRLEVGRLADLVVLRDDYFQVPVDEIRTLTSVLTMVGGRVVYGADVFAGLDGARG